MAPSFGRPAQGRATSATRRARLYPIHLGEFPPGSRRILPWPNSTRSRRVMVPMTPRSSSSVSANFASALRRYCTRRCRRGNWTPTALRPRKRARKAAAGANGAKPNAIKLGDGNDAADPVRVMPVLRALIAALPETPIPAALELSSEQIVVGGRSVQNFVGELRSDTKSWAVDRLDLRAPGATHVTLSGKAGNATPSDAASGRFKGALLIESSDPDALGDVVAGAQRTGLSQPEPVSPERRRHHRRQGLCHRQRQIRD